MALFNKKDRKSLDKYDIIKYHRSRLETTFQIMDKEEERKNPPQPNDDTKLRYDIQKDIKELVAEGKGEVDILVYLHNKYPDCKYEKYYASYISNAMSKYKPKNKEDNIR